ncbi:Choline/ethanolaminephosphotransferase [Coemansia reversa NRRL 1564]|uniref:Choline/ethanolaminephosphotransferase n=1 Tax=Coemansia reversa (strain ATCC 12441 / NRRL 1564) TaxID=763665 RepID=A0A2G5B577_COERN|nr:Choline/ethanolaminephosphotransferase [Coemansia reversa NRRL 1564]|eukprot:PIA14151.1 Choline/ethanolaminephosphotransferase [Coemansia reversa NRRL 1564]
MAPYIPQSYLPNLRKYKYQAVDKSLISRYVLKEYWNQLVKIFPLTMAANMVTLLGAVHVIVAMVLNQIYAPNLEEESPRWVYFAHAACVWIYGSFDAVDGKQARRTGTASPLGELFDHGCDSLVVTLIMLLYASVCQLGETWWTVALVFFALTNFYMATMEEYHTHVLFLGYFSGPVEGILCFSLAAVATGMYGPAFWATDLVGLMPLPQTLAAQLPQLTLAHSVVVGMGLALVPTVYTSFSNIARACREQQKSVPAAFSDAVPFAASIGSVVVWLAVSPDVRSNHLVLFLGFVGFAFSYIVGRVIVAHVTGAPFPKLNRMHIPIFVGTANALAPTFGAAKIFDAHNEVVLIWVCLAYTGAQYAHFALEVIDTICSYLDINCLTIKHKPAAALKKSS